MVKIEKNMGVQKNIIVNDLLTQNKIIHPKKYDCKIGYVLQKKLQRKIGETVIDG